MHNTRMKLHNGRSATVVEKPKYMTKQKAIEQLADRKEQQSLQANMRSVENKLEHFKNTPISAFEAHC